MSQLRKKKKNKKHQRTTKKPQHTTKATTDVTQFDSYPKDNTEY